MELNNFITLHLDLINLKINQKKSKICINTYCNKNANFNYENYLSINIRKHIYCKIHKLENMVDIIHKKCIICNTKQPSYNYKNEKMRLYCGDCKLDNMIDITNKRCISCNIKIPNFNYKDKETALYCRDCKLENMINIKSKKCINCNIKQPVFNYSNEKNALYCGDCKLDDMIDIQSKKCIICKNKRPNFNYETENKALYCGDCKLDDMIDIKSKKCINCKNKRPVFNYSNEKNALYCGDCKLENMINIKCKICINCNIKQPVFNYKDGKFALYCGDCKLEDMIDINHKKCKTPLCDIIIGKKFKGYCLRCFIHIFPESKIIRDYGTREAKVTEFIKKEFKDLNIIYNKQIQGGCSDHRPDIFIDCLTHSLIIEVDEHQHKRGNSYSIRCEIRRVNELFTSLADRPIVFIRFNPDSYTNSKNKLIKSCFEYTEDKGLPKANKTLQPRLKKLKEEIEKNINLIPNTNITTIKLFYDEI